ncbi:MAG: hypothetical protein QM715_01210 [Nibricoccus sp.]
MKKLVPMLLGCLFLSGCIVLPVPHTKWVSPRFEGTVVDTDTKMPLQNVNILLGGYLRSGGRVPVISTRSDKDGRFAVVATKPSLWVLVWLGPGDGIQGGEVRFESSGYDPVEEKRWQMCGPGSRVRIIVNVEMKKSSPNQAPLPTSMPVTPPASAAVESVTGAADL